MRPSSLPVLMAAIGLAGCAASPPASWQKPGADQQTIERDTSRCRTAARTEALRRYPYGATLPSVGAGGMVLSQQHDDVNRATVETAHYNDCMAGQGYRRT